MLAVQVACLVIAVPMLVSGLLRLSRRESTDSKRPGSDLIDTDIQGLEARPIATGDESLGKPAAIAPIVIAFALIVVGLVIVPLLGRF
jgi:hypothetical protein